MQSRVVNNVYGDWSSIDLTDDILLSDRYPFPYNRESFIRENIKLVTAFLCVLDMSVKDMHNTIRDYQAEEDALEAEEAINEEMSFMLGFDDIDRT